MPSIRSQPDEDIPVPVKRAVRGAHQEIINFDCKLTEQEVEENQHRKALEIWYIIFSSGKEAWPQGFDLGKIIRSRELDDMKLVFGSRSSNTIVKRGFSVLQFFKWYKGQYFGLCPFPLDFHLVDEYILHLKNQGDLHPR